MNKENFELQHIYINIIQKLINEKYRDDVEGYPDEKYLTTIQDISHLSKGKITGISLNDNQLILNIKADGVITALVISNPYDVRIIDVVDVDNTFEEVPNQQFKLSDDEIND